MIPRSPPRMKIELRVHLPPPGGLHLPGCIPRVARTTSTSTRCSALEKVHRTRSIYRSVVTIPRAPPRMKTLKQGASGNHRRKTKEDEGFYLQISRHDSSITIRDENPEAGADTPTRSDGSEEQNHRRKTKVSILQIWELTTERTTD
jgi:hypothetical protein